MQKSKPSIGQLRVLPGATPSEACYASEEGHPLGGLSVPSRKGRASKASTLEKGSCRLVVDPWETEAGHTCNLKPQHVGWMLMHVVYPWEKG